MATQNLTKLYEGADLSGAAGDLIYLPITFAGTLNGVGVYTDAAAAGDVVFSLWKNGAVQPDAAVTITTGNKKASVSGLNIALVDGDEIVLRRESGSISSPVTLNLKVDDGVSSSGASNGVTKYDPDVPYAVPSTEDDEFSGTPLAAKWSAINGFTLSNAVSNSIPSLLKLSADATANLRGIGQSLSGSVARKWRTKLSSIENRDTNTIGFGVCFRRSNTGYLFAVIRATPSSGNTVGRNPFSYEIYAGTTNASGLVDDGFSLKTLDRFTSVWFELEQTAGNVLTIRMSFDGIGFFQVCQSADSGAPTDIGLIYIPNVGGLSAEAYFDWFRKLQGTYTGKLLTL